MTKGLGTVYRRGDIWWIKWSVRGQAFYQSSGSHIKQDAVELLRKQLNRPRGPVRSAKVKVAELLDNVMAYYETHNPKSYKSFAVPVTKHLYKHFGGWKVAQVTTEAINDYKGLRKRDGASAASINRELALLRRAFGLAHNATPPLVAEIPKFHLLPEANPRKGFLEPEQYQQLLQALPEHLQGVFVVGYHTGVRKSEILNLRKDQVDLEAGQIRLNPGETKNEEGRYLPIYGDMPATIKKWMKQDPVDSPWLFHREGCRIGDLRPYWDDACIEVGLPDLLFHDLRRSAVRNMIRAGVPQEVAMKISGHKTASVFRRYNIVDVRDIDAAGRAMGRFMTAAKKRVRKVGK